MGQLSQTDQTANSSRLKELKRDPMHKTKPDAVIPAKAAGATLPASTDPDITYKQGHTDYKIRKNDTLGKIARRHETQLRKAGVWKDGESVWKATEKLAAFNKQQDVNFVLAPGNTLKIPNLEKIVAGETVHVVGKGDSLGTIAKQYKSQLQAAGLWQKGKSIWAGAVQELAKFNEMSLKQRLTIGQKIKIPPIPKTEVGQTSPQHRKEPLGLQKKPIITAPLATPASVQALKDFRDKPVTGETVHVVGKNDSLGTIAKEYKAQLQAAGVWQKGKSMWAGAIQELAKFNEMSLKQGLTPGQKIKIPSIPKTEVGQTSPLDLKEPLGLRNKPIITAPLAIAASVQELKDFRDKPIAALRLGKVLRDLDPIGGMDVLSKKNIPAVIALQGAMSRLKINGQKAFDFKGSMQHPQHKGITLHPVLGARNEYMAQKIESTYRALMKNPALPQEQRSAIAGEYKACGGMAGPLLFKALGVNIDTGLQGLVKGQTLEQTTLHKKCRQLVKHAYSEFQKAKGISGESPNKIGPKTAEAWQRDWQAMKDRNMKIVKVTDSPKLAKN